MFGCIAVKKQIERWCTVLWRAYWENWICLGIDWMQSCTFSCTVSRCNATLLSHPQDFATTPFRAFVLKVNFPFYVNVRLSRKAIEVTQQQRFSLNSTTHALIVCTSRRAYEECRCCVDLSIIHERSRLEEVVVPNCSWRTSQAWCIG